MTASPINLSKWLTRRNAIRGFIVAGVAALIAGGLLLAYLLLYVAPNLPSLEVITDYRPKIPLRIYTADNALIGEFGEEHRDFVPIKDIPEMMKKSVLAIEDKRFYDHNGIDWRRALGAARANLGGAMRQGGSTITMQVARNFFLTREKFYGRKLNEVMLAFKIEAALSKEQILELYMNQIYLGQRSFGFGAASQVYFGKPLKDLDIAEMAMLAGLPQNPARHNPAVNPKRAKQRQHVVLKSMRDLDYITEDQYQKALHETLHVSHRGQEFDTHAEYVAELARQVVYAQFKEDSYTKGISVYTTILKADQNAAYESVRRNVLNYDQRHGYRGPEAFITLPATEDERDDAIEEALQRRPGSDRLIPAVVLEVGAKSVKVQNPFGEEITISGDGLRLAANALSDKAKDTVRLRPGAVIRIIQEKNNWSITQVPQVAAAFVSIDSVTGGYHAMVGGFDYNLQKFNHVTQAWRQPGSSIKPFVYSAALEKGFSPATLINDVPLDLTGAETGNEAWSPKNDDGKFDGPITMRTALAESKNVASVRILRSITVPYAHNYLGKFGFDLAKHPKNLTMALGTGSVTPAQLVGAYSVFANGGYTVEPYLIAKIVDGSGKIISEAKPRTALPDDARVIDPRNAFVTDSMLRQVTRTGTGAAVARLGRPDLAGKTGTSSDAIDGWFAGYGGGIVAVSWMGYDDSKSLGGKEFGSSVALPIWIDYMKVALQSRPPQERQVPAGLTQVDGEWLYDEFTGDAARHTLDMDDVPPGAENVAPQPAGTTPPPPTN
ncbi:penicillin-binding protein 1A [Duganella sp. BJB488]|uniref:penicillin-binding protein 1A n=1 Tax=unclassified Duganella TaxID=2636909 RepID=UPI000E34FD53|nr:MULTISPECIES: penicillin-binding protein 1A [unclassified Duganella]NVD74442.1 penicillin-binding protein 1A [Duganella sp. BJB1802]RFP21986.1 penicillin-binding protein 1A [Duganella sp. BJB489]RFP23532.1 penicillin-binding protein 1A [Duganella sp. BJB488]RFP38973.1 penicillin-binding protein 1A [Duganella sp. BJB480]